jgi:hypothetical protein
MVALVGVPGDGNLSGSEWLVRRTRGEVAGPPVRIDLGAEVKLQRAVLALAQARVLSSAHDISDGGIAACLAECCVAGRIGCAVELEVPKGQSLAAMLFHEAPSRVIVSFPPENREKVQAACEEQGVPFALLGFVGGDTLEIEDVMDVPVQVLAESHSRALESVVGPRAREAFDTSRESSEVAATFGEHRFGQSCLLATRLIEAGVRFATVSFGGWDTHSNNFTKSKESLLPQFDQGLAAMLNALSQRGLLESTLVFVTGEFGRTPKINDKAGRDHWPRAMFVLLAGGGVRGGQVLGASDDKGMGPAGEPFTPDQVAATFYHGLGIDYQREYQTNTGRPVMIVREGSVIPDVFA